jgi:alpha-tubulin suppressor-like RCC1 family protein
VNGLQQQMNSFCREELKCICDARGCPVFEWASLSLEIHTQKQNVSWNTWILDDSKGEITSASLTQHVLLLLSKNGDNECWNANSLQSRKHANYLSLILTTALLQLVSTPYFY